MTNLIKIQNSDRDDVISELEDKLIVSNCSATTGLVLKVYQEISKQAHGIPSLGDIIAEVNYYNFQIIEEIAELGMQDICNGCEEGVSEDSCSQCVLDYCDSLGNSYSIDKAAECAYNVLLDYNMSFTLDIYDLQEYQDLIGVELYSVIENMETQSNTLYRLTEMYMNDAQTILIPSLIPNGCVKASMKSILFNPSMQSNMEDDIKLLTGGK